MSEESESKVDDYAESIPEDDKKRKRSLGGDDVEESKSSPEETSAESYDDAQSEKKIKEDAEAVSEPSATSTGFDAATKGIQPYSYSNVTPLPVSTVLQSIQSDQNLLTEIMEIAQDKVASVIGTKGMIIQETQKRTSCKIYVKQDFPDGVNRQVIFTGTAQQIAAARDLVNKIIVDGPTAIHVSATSSPVVNYEMDCPQTLVGRIIGAGGATIRDLQARSGSKIQINQDFPEGVPRKIQFSGTQECVQNAITLVQMVMENGPQALQVSPLGGMGAVGGSMYGMGSMPQSLPMPTNPNGYQTQVVECAKMFVGRLIGKGGETIQKIQQKSGAKVQIDQNVPEGTPCKINMTGTPQTLALAQQIVFDIMQNGPDRAMSLHGPSPSVNMGMMGMMSNPAMAMMGVNPQAMSAYGGYPGAASAGMGMGMGMQSYGMQGAGQQYGAHAGVSASGYQGTGGMGMYGASQGQQYQQHHQMAHQQSNYGHAASVGSHHAVQKQAVASSAWTEHRSDDGQAYWYNASTGVSQWERPAGV